MDEVVELQVVDCPLEVLLEGEVAEGNVHLPQEEVEEVVVTLPLVVGVSFLPFYFLISLGRGSAAPPPGLNGAK